MESKQKPVKFCPKCGSTNINFPVFYRPSIWKCLDCGYEGAFIVEDSKLAEKIKEDYQRKTEKTEK
jgi:ribosomal protein L37AE/L43A